MNSYVVWHVPSAAVLIDPAEDLTPEILEEEGITRVTDIFITHLQAEHVAGASHFPEARVHISDGDCYLAAGEAVYLSMDTRWKAPWEWETRGDYQGHMGGALNERPPTHKLPFHHLLRAGQRLLGFEVIPTPGHGKHAISLMMLASGGKRLIFCGDLIFGDGQLWNWFDAEWDYGLERGQRSLLESARRVAVLKPDLLLPAHGPPITKPGKALKALADRLERVLDRKATPATDNGVGVFNASKAPGFVEILPHVLQWRKTPGNCAVLISESGSALLIDDGLCHWVDVRERRSHHREVIRQLKSSTGITRIEYVIPTHYHGDHIENIADLVVMERSDVLALNVVADVLESPHEFNLACKLPWYDVPSEVVPVDRRFRDGQKLKWHEYELEFFHMGGQTYYHAGISVEVDGKRALFVGDAISGTDPDCEPVLCYNDAEPETRGWAYAVDRMIERSPDLLIAGHAVAMANPMPLLRQKRENWRTRLAQFSELNPREDSLSFFSPFTGG